MKKIIVTMLSSGWEPLYKTSFKRAIKAIVSGRAEVVEYYPCSYYPKKVKFKNFIAKGLQKKHNPKITKLDLFIRDEGSCQYCQNELKLHEATIDHVLPICKGGKNEWTNLVIACLKCNQEKGDKLLINFDKKLNKKPQKPDCFFIS